MGVFIAIILMSAASIANAGQYETAYADGYDLTLYGDAENTAWCKAQQLCEEKGSDGLAILDSSNLNVAAESIIPSGGRAWIGGNDLTTEGWFRWTNGNSVNSGYNKWRSGEPNDGFGTEDCMEAIGFNWNDRTCTDSNMFICQLATSRQTSAHYAVFEYSDAFSQYNSKANYWEAQRECENKGMRLARVDSIEEFEVIQKKIARNRDGKYWIASKYDKCVYMSHNEFDVTDCTKTSLPYVCEVVTPWAVSLSDESPKLREGEDLQIECTAKGFPLPDVAWYRDGDRITMETDQRVHQAVVAGGSTLVIKKADLADAGQYRCYATNAAINFENKVFALLGLKVYATGKEMPVEGPRISELMKKLIKL
uniref:macrophage mannose receptor 1-like n=1 Tax=Styela clava TaxID=7725 RepID=UPI001939E292|nr:macrophage mannose receptor 1-like [Styela clava]